MMVRPRARRVSVLAGILVASIGSSSIALAEAEGCSAVTTAALNVTGTAITASKLAEAEKGQPRHCVLTGKSKERTGVDAADLTRAPIARAIIAAHYGKKPDYSYMYGCSNGGRHAMVDASRMPEVYDGFLVGNPGFDLPKAAIQHAWDLQNFTKINPDIRKSFSKENARLLSAKILEACDGLDGVEDGLTSN